MPQIQRKTGSYLAFGKREKGVSEGPSGCLSNHLQGLKLMKLLSAVVMEE